MDDKTLLELAAKAEGHGVFFDEGSGLSFLHIGNGPKRDALFAGVLWDPLNNDGDALRLAVKLKLNIMQGEYSCGANDEREVDVVEVFVNTDKHAATRRAIVRAAAAIGEKT